MVTATESELRFLPPFTRRDLSRLGLTDRRLYRLLRSGVIAQPVRGVYVHSSRVDDEATRVAIVARALPAAAVACRRTAAWIHGEDARTPAEKHRPLPLECLVATGRVVPSRPGLVVVESALDDGDVDERGGLPVTSAARTALDVARYCPPHMGLAVLDAMAHRGLVDVQDLALRVEDLAGQRFIARARRAVALCEPSTESYGESWLRLRVVDAGFPRPEPQIWVVDEWGQAIYRLDLGWRDRRLSIEYDGLEFHASPGGRARDIARREDLIRRFDWTCIGVGRGEVLGTSLTLERGLGELLGQAPTLRTRTW